MKKPILFQLLILSILITSCTNQIDKLKGIYTVDKNSLKEYMQKQMDKENAFATNLLNTAIENATIEFEIKSDSIQGLISMVGVNTLIYSKIINRNDSIVIRIDESDAFLTPTSAGLTLRYSKSDFSINMTKTGQNKLSEKTEKAIKDAIKAEKEKKEFLESLGKWQKGDYVDEFGDKTGNGYVYYLVKGIHENSVSTNSEVYIKASILGDNLTFQIFNSTFSMKETFPESEFGTIKIKYPDGKVESERIFFFQNSASESADDKNYLIYNYLNNNQGELKLLLDLNTASNYYTDKYQFNMQQKNLKEILKGLKKK